MALETTAENVEGRVPITVLALDGEVDASNFASIIDEVGALYRTGTRHLLIDLTNVRFLASSGLVALHSAVRIMRGDAPPDPEAGWEALHSLDRDTTGGVRQSEVRLCGAQPAVERVLVRTGLTQLFEIHPDRTSAIAAF